MTHARLHTVPFIAGLIALAAQHGCDRASPIAPARDVAVVQVADAGAGPVAVASGSVADAAVAPSDATVAPTPLSVVLISIDSLRGDIFFPRSEAGRVTRPIAPNLTALAQRAVAYTRAYALSSYTSMSVGGFLAGRMPGEVRRDGFFFGTYPSDVVMFPERLQAAGVRTIAAQAHFYLRRGGSGLDQGFDVYEMVPGLRPNNLTDVDVTDEQHEAIAERLLADRANTSGPFFAWFHFMDPHDEYISHAGIGPYGRSQRDRYEAEVTWSDRHVGRLVDFIGRQPWSARTAIILTADHGEMFGEHGHYRHGFYLWQELVHVPWFFVIPGVAPRHIDVARSHLDLAPTVLDLLGVAPAADLPGRSLAPEIRSASATPETRDVWIDLPRTSDNDRRRALIHGHYKVIAYGDDSRFEVYDLDSDPTESHSLQSTERATFDAMVARYRAAQSRFRDVHPYRARNLRGAPNGRGW